jgi:hypothetical protein
VTVAQVRVSPPCGPVRPFRLEEGPLLEEWDDAPMPHSIFFTAAAMRSRGAPGLGPRSRGPFARQSQCSAHAPACLYKSVVRPSMHTAAPMIAIGRMSQFTSRNQRQSQTPARRARRMRGSRLCGRYRPSGRVGITRQRQAGSAACGRCVRRHAPATGPDNHIDCTMGVER